MPDKNLIPLGCLLFIFASGLGYADCPSKISPMLCPEFSGAQDSAYLDVRIVLDPKLDSGFYYPKNTPLPPLPTWVASESLIVRYDLRQLSHPESAYVRPYGNELRPLSDWVHFHNASATKGNIGRLVSESFVVAVEPGCSRRIPTTMCTEINAKPDTTTLFIKIGFRPDIDSIIRKAFLAEYSVRDTSWTFSREGLPWSGNCFGDGSLAQAGEIRRMGPDPRLAYVEQGQVLCTVSVNRNSHSGSYTPKTGAWRAYRKYRLDGRFAP